jgi:hypothetical protein
MKAYTITTRSDLYPEAKPVTRCGTFQPVENEHPIWTAIKEHFGTHLSRNLGKSDIGDIMSDLIHDPDATEYGFCTEGGECGIEIEDDPNATLQAIKERIQTIDFSGSKAEDIFHDQVVHGQLVGYITAEEWEVLGEDDLNVAAISAITQAFLQHLG